MRTITAEQKDTFNLYFNRNEYEDAKEKVEKILSECENVEEAILKLNGFDDEVNGNTTTFLCEVEFTPKYPDEDEYYSFEFNIGWNKDNQTAEIWKVGLYCGDNGIMAYFNPTTCEIEEWMQ